MVCLEKVIIPIKRNIHSDLGLFLLQSTDTFNKSDSQTAEFVMEMMQNSICSHYSLSNKQFNLILSSYVCNLYKSDYSQKNSQFVY